jgi:hypothetical protein
MGGIVFERVFLRSPVDAERGERHPTFVMLSEDPALPISATTLWRNLHMFLLVRRIPWVASSTHLGVAHLRAVLGLPLAQQQRLLARADEEAWTKSVLEAEAAELRAPRRDGRGRPRRPGGIRRLLEAERALADLDLENLASELRRSGENDLERARQALLTLQAVGTGVTHLVRLLAMPPSDDDPE